MPLPQVLIAPYPPYLGSCHIEWQVPGDLWLPNNIAHSLRTGGILPTHSLVQSAECRAHANGCAERLIYPLTNEREAIWGWGCGRVASGRGLSQSFERDEGRRARLQPCAGGLQSNWAAEISFLMGSPRWASAAFVMEVKTEGLKYSRVRKTKWSFSACH